MVIPVGYHPFKCCHIFRLILLLIILMCPVVVLQSPPCYFQIFLFISCNLFFLHFFFPLFDQFDFPCQHAVHQLQHFFALFIFVHFYPALQIPVDMCIAFCMDAFFQSLIRSEMIVHDDVLVFAQQSDRPAFPVASFFRYDKIAPPVIRHGLHPAQLPADIGPRFVHMHDIMPHHRAQDLLSRFQTFFMYLVVPADDRRGPQLYMTAADLIHHFTQPLVRNGPFLVEVY